MGWNNHGVILYWSLKGKCIFLFTKVKGQGQPHTNILCLRCSPLPPALVLGGVLTDWFVHVCVWSWSLSECCTARLNCVFLPCSKTSSPLPPTKTASLIGRYFSLFLHLTYIHLFVALAALEMNPLSLCVCYEKKLGWTDESGEQECPCNTARWRAWRRRTG